jgi:hypothetical protein
MAEETINSCVLLISALTDGDSDMNRTDAESQLNSLNPEQLRVLLIVCASVIADERYPVHLKCTSFKLLTLVLQPDDDHSIDSRRAHWTDRFSVEERHIFPIIAVSSLTSLAPEIRSFAEEYILVLSRVDLPESLNIFSLLLDLMSNGDVTFETVSTLRRMYKSRIISELPPEIILPLLERYVGMFYEVFDAPGQYDRAFIQQVVLTFSELIPNLIDQFRPIVQQQRLVTSIRNLFLATDADLYDSILVLFRIHTVTYYNDWEAPIGDILTFTCAGLAGQHADNVSISLRWWHGFCAREDGISSWNTHIARYENTLLLACTEEGLQMCSDVRIWVAKPLHYGSRHFVDHALGIVVSLLLDGDRPPDDNDAALSLLRCLGGNMPDLVFPSVLHAVGRQGDAGCLSRRSLLLALDLFRSAPDGCETVIEYLLSQFHALIHALTNGDSEMSELDLEVLVKIIYRFNQAFTVTDLIALIQAFIGLELAIPLPCAYFSCLTALFQCPAACDLGSEAESLLVFFTEQIESKLSEFDSPEVVNHAFGVLANIIRLLPSESSDFVSGYYQFVMEKLTAVVSTNPTEAIIMSLVQQCYLGILGVLFRVHSTVLIENASCAIASLLYGAQEQRIPVVADLIITFTTIVFAMRNVPDSVDPDLLHPLWCFGVSVLAEDETNVAAETYLLLAHLMQYLPDIPLEVLWHIVTEMKKHLHHRSCLPQFIPKFLTRFAAIIKEFPRGLPDDLLAECLVEYQWAFSIPLNVEDEQALAYANEIWRSIFWGLRALIYAARGNHAFLSVHREDWFRGIERIVHEYGLYLNIGTLRCYVAFMAEALENLPARCWPVMIQVYLRVPLICAVAANHPQLTQYAIRVWNAMLRR